MKTPYLTLAVALVVVAVAFCGAVATGLEYARDAISRGDLWRALTGHLVHFSPSHAGWNLAGFVGLGATCELSSRRRFAVAVVLAIIGISAALWISLPGLETYRGLSGVNAALFALLAVRLVCDRFATGDRAIASAVTVLICVFLWQTFAAWETHDTIFVGDLGAGVAPVPLAHAVGLAAGAATAAIR